MLCLKLFNIFENLIGGNQISTVEDSITSKFDISYYLKGITGAMLFTGYTLYRFYCCIFYPLMNSKEAYYVTAFSVILSALYLYFFSKSWKRITVTSEGIIIDRIILKKRITIPYSMINSVGIDHDDIGSHGLRTSRGFLIEFSNTQSVSFNEEWYENYSKLTMAIYLYKNGPGHGRDRYLVNHPHNV